MLALIRSLSAPLTSLVLLILASGLLNTFVAVRLEIEGYDPEEIGLVASALYAGLLIGSLRIDRWITRVGYIYSFNAFAIVSAGLVIMQGFWINAWFWAALRCIGGICMAGIFISIESWLLTQSASNMRSAVLSLYLAVFYAALTLGQLLFKLVGVTGFLPFFVTAFLCILSIVPMMFIKGNEPKIEHSTHLSLLELFCLSPLGFSGGIISGMVLSGIYGLVPVYAKTIGLSIGEIGDLMAMIIFGGLSLQWPLGRWADRWRRLRVLCIVSFLSACFALSIAWIDHHSFILLLLLAWCFGGFSFTLYPLSMAYTCENIETHQIISVTGGFVLSYGMGAIAGPLLAPMAMDWIGAPGLFYFLAAISLVLAIFSLKE